MKITILFSGNFWVEGHPRHFEKGEQVIINKEDAERMIKERQAERTKKKVKNDR